MIEVKISGIDDVRRKLRQLGDAGRASTLKGAIREASEPVVQAAKAKAPSPTVARGIRVVNVVVKSEGEVIAEVGLPGGRRPWFHGLFYELGTGPRSHKSGKSTGSMPASPFLRPAFDEERDTARRVFGEALKRRLEAVARG